MKDILLQLAIAAIPAFVSGLLTYLITRKQIKVDLDKVKENNKHEIDKLIKQHEVDIDNIETKHELEMKAKDKEHGLKLELLEKEKEIEIAKSSKQLENETMYGVMGDLFKGAFNSDTVKKKIEQEIEKGFKNQ